MSAPPKAPELLNCNSVLEPPGVPPPPGKSPTSNLRMPPPDSQPNKKSPAAGAVSSVSEAGVISSGAPVDAVTRPLIVLAAMLASLALVIAPFDSLA